MFPPPRRGGQHVWPNPFIKIDAERGCKRFYERMDSNNNAPFSFIFNASFNNTGYLNYYEDGLVTYGYVVEAEEFTTDTDPEQPEQLMLRIKLLLCNIVFVGKSYPRELIITQD